MHGRHAQSEVLGFVLLVGIVVTTVVGVVALGNGLIADSRSRTQHASVETQFTRLDSQASLVAYGVSDRRQVTLTLAFASVGNVEVVEDAGWIRLTHHNYTSDEDEVLYNQSMGALIYQGEGSDVAYQGGGVFVETGNGSVVVTPPEVHHRTETLTLPLVQIRGTGAAAETTRATIRSRVDDRAVYPNESATYDGLSRSYRNPVNEGTVRLTVHSEYYRAWEQYFRSWDVGIVESVDHANRTVSVAVEASGTYGDFGMPSPGDAIHVTGYKDEHALNHFEITLVPDSEDNADFADTDWALRANDGGRTFVVHFTADGKICGSGNIDVTIGYENSTTTQTWERTDAFSENATAFSYDCSGERPSLHVNFTGDETLTYASGPDGVAFDQHADHGEPTTFALGDATSVDHLVNHYLALLDSNVQLTVDDSLWGWGDEDSSPGHSASGGIDEGDSFGTIRYGRSNVVTFLHVSENEIAVELG